MKRNMKRIFHESKLIGDLLLLPAEASYRSSLTCSVQVSAWLGRPREPGTSIAPSLVLYVSGTAYLNDDGPEPEWLLPFSDGLQSLSLVRTAPAAMRRALQMIDGFRDRVTAAVVTENDRRRQLSILDDGARQ